MDKFDRIYALHNVLSHYRQPVPLTKIMSELECAKATAKRIIEHMRLYLDAPISYDRERNGYYYDLAAGHPFELPGIWFNTSELHALLTAQVLLERVDPGLYSEQLAPLRHKIKTILENAGEKDDESSRRIRILALAKRQFNNHIFRQVASAALKRKQLHIQYNGRGDGETSERDISPQRLVHYRDNWYLDAWCHSKNDYRTFAVERITQARTLSKRAKAISEQDLDGYFSSAFGIFSGTAKHTAILHFIPKRARWVAEEEWHPEQQSRWLDNGDYELRIPYGNPSELIMDILKYGADVEVVSPASLRNEVKRRIESMRAIYC
jgi:predicted DNA-binding transcriptional regulator YafY